MVHFDHHSYKRRTVPKPTPLGWALLALIFCACVSLISYQNGVRDEHIRSYGGMR